MRDARESRWSSRQSFRAVGEIHGRLSDGNGRHVSGLTELETVHSEIRAHEYIKTDDVGSMSGHSETPSVKGSVDRAV